MEAPSRSSVSVGRADTNDIVIDDALVSEGHCLIEASPNGYVVRDSGSFAGTYVNGAPVREAVLREGDLVAVGPWRRQLRGGSLQPQSGIHPAGVEARDVSYHLPDGKRLLSELSFTLPPSSLTAVIGPSGAGKTTLFRVLTGAARPTAGRVEMDGVNVHDNPAYFRSRLGVVPQDDVVHLQLRVRDSLRYAARLRFPPDLQPEYLNTRVCGAIEELQMGAHELTAISQLSGGQRKRTSVAMELLSEPSFLFLDEPTSGLDPGLDKSVMLTLRELADGGRTVVVITHSVANLGVCDQVIVLAPGGIPAYMGPPAGVAHRFGTEDYSAIFTEISSNPEGSRTRPRAPGQPGWDPTKATDTPGSPTEHAPRSLFRLKGRLPTWQQVWQGPEDTGEPEPPIKHQVQTLAQRQLAVMLADRAYLIFNLLLPVILGALAWAVPGSEGLAIPSDPSSEAMQILVIIVVGAGFMGTAAAIRDLVSERAIYLRERAVGLSPKAYLWSKTVVFASLALLQTLVLLVVLGVRKPMPSSSALLPIPVLELWIALALTCFAGALLGLLVSAYVRSSEHAMPLLVVSVMAQMVLCAGLIPVAGRAFLAPVSLLAPARWGYAASAATTELLVHLPAPREDALWESFASTWVLCVLALAWLSLGLWLITLRRLSMSYGRD